MNILQDVTGSRTNKVNQSFYEFIKYIFNYYSGKKIFINGDNSNNF